MYSSRSQTSQKSIAITAVAGRFPNIVNKEELWQQLCSTKGMPPLSTIAKSQSSYSNFGIPPIYRDSINNIQLTLFDLAKEVLEASGGSDHIDYSKTDVIFCTSFGLNRAYENFNRLFSQHLSLDVLDNIDEKLKKEIIDELKTRLNKKFCATSHDKVGEMASTIPARIASFFKLRGKAVVFEDEDFSGMHAVVSAVESLQLGHANAVLILSAQQFESKLLREILIERGIHCDLAKPTSDFNGCGGLSEGACAILLQSAEKSSNNALAYIHKSTIITGRTNSESLKEVIAEQLINPNTRFIDYIKNKSSEDIRQTQELVNLAGLESCTVGSFQNAIGFSHCNCVLASLCCSVLSLNKNKLPSGFLSNDNSDDSFKSHNLNHLSLLTNESNAIIYLSAISGEKGLISISQSDTSEHYLKHSLKQYIKHDQDIAIVAMGARFGLAKSTHDFWTRLNDSKGSIRNIDVNQPKYESFYSNHIGAPSSFYINKASMANESFESTTEPKLNNFIHDASLELITEALDEAMTTWPLPSYQHTLIVTATNLTSQKEKSIAFEYFIPELQQQLITILENKSLPKAKIERIIKDLNDWNVKLNNPQLVKSISASDISRTIKQNLSIDAQCLAVEAACAGSMAAIDIAVNALKSGRVETAIVAGVELPVNINDLCLCSSQRMLDPNVISTFTSNAIGFTPGDGAGVIVLKRVSDARSNNDKILAQIKAIASCTFSKSVIAPNIEGQVESMKRAFAQVSFKSEEIDFVETHGTGTTIGDYVEVQSLATIYNNRKNKPLFLGALKTRFGHMFAAAGIASVIKTVLSMQHKQFPPNIIRGELNSKLTLDNFHFDVLKKGKAPIKSDQPISDQLETQQISEHKTMKCAINSFGTGGINYHMLIDRPIE